MYNWTLNITSFSNMSNIFWAVRTDKKNKNSDIHTARQTDRNTKDKTDEQTRSQAEIMQSDRNKKKENLTRLTRSRLVSAIVSEYFIALGMFCLLRFNYNRSQCKR